MLILNICPNQELTGELLRPQLEETGVQRLPPMVTGLLCKAFMTDLNFLFI